MFRAVVYLALLPIIVGSCALSVGAHAQTPSVDQRCVDGPSSPNTNVFPGDPPLLSVCTSVSQAPLTHCSYGIGDGAPIGLANPEAGKRYDLPVPAGAISRGEVKPFTAQCSTAVEDSGVRIGTVTFPEAPAPPVLLP